MKKTIYNTPYVYKHDIFRERLKTLCKKKGLTYAELACKLDYEECTIKGWSRKAGGFPNMDKLIHLSCIFDVDIAYLLGDQNCTKIKSQRIQDLSGLDESAANIIESINDNKRNSYVLNRLLTHKDFPRLLETMFQYAHCHNVEIKMEDKTLSTDNFFPFTDSKKKTAFKFTATDTFSEILEDMYRENEQSMEYARGDAILKEMFSVIHRYKHEDDNYDTTESLIKIIDACLKILPNYRIYNIVRKFGSEYILKNYMEISKMLDIDLITPDPLQKGSD